MEKIFQVSEFNEFVNLYLRKTGEVVVEGEISEFKPYQGKWLYITLKDESANLSVFAVAYNISGWQSLEVGMKVQATGVPGLHQKSGKFSLNASSIIPAGEGALKLAYEKLRRQLEGEGLFSSERKRQIPQFPRHIGLITARGSDAYNDFIKVLTARFGGIKISFFPVQVQGRDAAHSIVKAFAYFNTQKTDLDAIVLTRGGGSLEDLQAFNDEQVVRAVFGSTVPVICGVGHEKDISLCDLAADLRASTPSNAAELLVRHKDEYVNIVSHKTMQLLHYIEVMVNEKKHQVNSLLTVLEKATRTPKQTYVTYMHLLDRHLTNIQFWTRQKVELRRQIIDRLLLIQKQLVIDNKLKSENLHRLLNTLDYQEIMKRGYSITRNGNGQIVTSVHQVSNNQSMTSQLYDGKITAVITDIQS